MAEVGVSEAIRQALQQFGTDSGKAVTGQIKEFVKATFPDLAAKVDTTTFSSTLSNLRKKARDAEGAKEFVGETTREAPEQGQAEIPLPAQRREEEKEWQEFDRKTDKVGEIISAVETLKGLVAKLGKEQVRRLLEVI